MKISQKDWQRYISDLRKTSKKAADMISWYLQTHDISTKAGRKALLDFAYAVTNKYGEGAAEKACQLHDAVAEMSGKAIPPAVPAKMPSYPEVAKTVNGMLLYTDNPDYVGSSVGRLVKRTGVDTTMQNAIRDGAEWAWVPSGDSCAFCLVLASQGWQRASKEAMAGGHAEHIHNNCDCTYTIRFDKNTQVEGYDPDDLRKQYEAAEGTSSKDKINYMRRQQYAANKDAINAQKRAAYAAKKQSGQDLIRQAKAQSLTAVELREIENNDIIKLIKNHQELKEIIESLDIWADKSLDYFDLEIEKHFVAGIAEIKKEFPKIQIRRLLINAIEDEYGSFDYKSLYIWMSSVGLEEGIGYAFPTGAHEAGHAMDRLMSMAILKKEEGYAEDVVKKAISNLGLRPEEVTVQRYYLSGNFDIIDDAEYFAHAFSRMARRKHCDLSEEIIRIVRSDYDALFS